MPPDECRSLLLWAPLRAALGRPRLVRPHHRRSVRRVEPYRRHGADVHRAQSTARHQRRHLQRFDTARNHLDAGLANVSVCCAKFFWEGAPEYADALGRNISKVVSSGLTSQRALNEASNEWVKGQPEALSRQAERGVYELRRLRPQLQDLTRRSERRSTSNDWKRLSSERRYVPSLLSFVVIAGLASARSPFGDRSIKQELVKRTKVILVTAEGYGACEITGRSE